MTYSTCRIDVLKDAAIERIPDFGILRERLIPKLKREPGHGHYWVPDVSRWAKAQNIPIHYIDNCWIEIELSADALAAFLRETYGAGSPEAAAPTASLSARNRYVLVAEEF